MTQKIKEVLQPTSLEFEFEFTDNSQKISTFLQAIKEEDHPVSVTLRYKGLYVLKTTCVVDERIEKFTIEVERKTTESKGRQQKMTGSK